MTCAFSEVARVLRSMGPRALTLGEMFDAGEFDDRKALETAVHDMYGPVLTREGEPGKFRFRIREDANIEGWLANRKSRARPATVERRTMASEESEPYESAPASGGAMKLARKIYDEVLSDLIGSTENCGDPVLRRLAKRVRTAAQMLEAMGSDA